MLVVVVLVVVFVAVAAVVATMESCQSRRATKDRRKAMVGRSSRALLRREV
jgi:hypothetical protein